MVLASSRALGVMNEGGSGESAALHDQAGGRFGERLVVERRFDVKHAHRTAPRLGNVGPRWVSTASLAQASSGVLL